MFAKDRRMMAAIAHLNHLISCIAYALARRVMAYKFVYPFARRLLKNNLLWRLGRRIKVNAMAEDSLPYGNDQIPTQHWDKHVQLVESKELKGWLDWEFIEEEYIRPQVSGDKSVYYIQHFVNKHLKSIPVKRVLSLGCGGGNLERAFIQLKIVESVDAFDASPESIRVAKEMAKKEGMAHCINYEIRDINHIQLESGAYDFVVAKMSLHHFENLEHIFNQVRQSLKPDGMLMFNDFVGPTRFQWTDRQLKLANQLLETLPEEKHWSAQGNMPLVRLERPTVEEMIKMDPTEAVRSSDIIPALTSCFEIVERKNYGGTLLHTLLTHVMSNFDLHDESDLAMLRMLFLFERTMIEQGVIDSDFTYIVAYPSQV